MSVVWRMEKPRLPYGVLGFGVAVLKDSLMVCGGLEDDGPLPYADLKRVRRLDLFRDRSTDLTPMLSRRAFGGAASLNGRVYAVGGYNEEDEPMAAVEFYDLEKNTWQPVAGLPLPLGHFAMVATNNRLYVFGGRSTWGGTFTTANAALCYDPAVDAWITLADMPTARRYCSACVGPGGLIYVIGGKSEDGRYLRCVEAYEIRNDRWLKKSDMISARSAAGCGYVDGRIFALGGGGDEDGVRSDIEFYDEDTGMWSVHPCRLSQPKESFGCVVMPMKKGSNWTGEVNDTSDDEEAGQE
ncbi:kelch-like protein 17 [Paramacrobiotus metropolitanus]|uniref:kelch-like protein 17 n=1 Tax=Paramacrobiotus metropolitanus TaxID=2943436 RepID=UPI0024463071|nr:kelch-like protein 17 [Paramacrobiotus metropolitanus]